MKKKTLTPSENLIQAVVKGSLKGVKAAIEAGADVNTYDETWGTALYTAAQFNHTRIARYLLTCPGIDITKGEVSHYPQGVAGIICLHDDEQYNHTPLYTALHNGNLSIAQMLLTHPDKGKYLQADENWESTIEDTFNYSFSGYTLNFLLDASLPYPQLHQFTVTTAVKQAFSHRELASELAELLRHRAINEIKLTQQPLTEHIINQVYEDDNDNLAYSLTCAEYFCDVAVLRTTLQAALLLAQKNRYYDCQQLLEKKLATL